MIDWQSPQNHILINPRMPKSLQEEMQNDIKNLDSLKSHIFLATSGSSGALKWVALSKSALLVSAEAVNKHLQSDHRDIWLNPLPNFHVGGLGITARGFLSKACVVPCNFAASKWDPQYFLKMLEDSNATLTSLVPTQVFDLVCLKLRAPSSLRAVVVGGGAMSEKVYLDALKLGWKLLPSYGLTECASQVATAPYGCWELSGYPLLQPLSHVELFLDGSGYLKIKSRSLLTGYMNQDRFYDPKVEGVFTTEDKVIFEGQFIRSISRGEHFVKIGGENVDLLRLEKILEEEKLTLNIEDDMALIAIEEDRLGHRLHLAIAASSHEKSDQLISNYHRRVFPFERIYQTHFVAEIPRSPLKKVLKNKLKELILFQN